MALRDRRRPPDGPTARRLDVTRRAALLMALDEIGTTEDREPAGDPWRAMTRLADRQRLTVYDAANLELAQRMRSLVATLDTALQRAAQAAAVDALG